MSPLNELRNERMPFGEHQGKIFFVIPIRYLEWISNQHFVHNPLRAKILNYLLMINPEEPYEKKDPYRSYPNGETTNERVPDPPRSVCPVDELPASSVEGPDTDEHPRDPF